MVFNIVLSTLLILHLSRQIVCDDSLVHRYADNIEFEVSLNELDSTNVTFSLPIIIDQDAHYAKVKCNVLTNECYLYKYVSSRDQTHKDALEKICRLKHLPFKDTIVNHMDVIIFGSHKVLIDWIFRSKDVSGIEKFARRIAVVQLANCHVNNAINVKIIRPQDEVEYEETLDKGEIKTLRLKSSHHIIVDNDRKEFTVFYDDFRMCYLGKAYATYDEFGELQGLEKCYYSRANNRRVSSSSGVFITGDTYIIRDKSDNVWTGFIMNQEGTEHTRLPASTYNTLYDSYRISSRFNRVSMCELPDQETPFHLIKCSVYERFYPSKKHHMTIQFPYEVDNFEIYNQLNGELLVLTTDNTHIDELKNYHLWTYDMHGKRIGEPRTLKGTKCLGKLQDLTTYFTTSSSNEVCAIFSCVKGERKESSLYEDFEPKFIVEYHFAVECLSNEDSDNYNVLGYNLF